MAVLLERGLALLFRGGSVVGDESHVAFLLVAVMTLDRPIVHCLLNLERTIKQTIQPLFACGLGSSAIKIYFRSVKSFQSDKNLQKCFKEGKE